MTIDGMTPQDEVRGSVGDRGTSLPAGETKEAAMPAFAHVKLKARVEEILNRRPAVGLAAGVVPDGSFESFYGHGVADIASGTSVTEDTLFRIGSITH